MLAAAAFIDPLSGFPSRAHPRPLEDATPMAQLTLPFDISEAALVTFSQNLDNFRQEFVFCINVITADCFSHSAVNAGSPCGRNRDKGS
jgi:hypothetical protein